MQVANLDIPVSNQTLFVNDRESIYARKLPGYVDAICIEHTFQIEVGDLCKYQRHL